MRSRSWRLRNLLTTSAPKVKETPRSFSPQPWTSLSGSDHSRSHSRPGTWCVRSEAQLSHQSLIDMLMSKSLYMWMGLKVFDYDFRSYAHLSYKKVKKYDDLHEIMNSDRPVSGTSVGLIIRRICSMDCRSGDSPERKTTVVD